MSSAPPTSLPSRTTRWKAATVVAGFGVVGSIVIAACVSTGGGPVETKNVDVILPTANPGELLPVAAFVTIDDLPTRSAAYFREAGKVLQHPRCINCHPGDDRPRQRDLETHLPAVVRGDDDHGAPVLRCDSCHQANNVVGTKVPGAPKWGLAPISMAWQGRTLHEICEQLKDTKRNGGKTLDEIVEHSATDVLVAWGWNPGADREPAPGSQQAFGELIDAWAKSGAVCPPHEPASAVWPVDAPIRRVPQTTTTTTATTTNNDTTKAGASR